MGLHSICKRYSHDKLFYIKKRLVAYVNNCIDSIPFAFTSQNSLSKPHAGRPIGIVVVPPGHIMV